MAKKDLFELLQVRHRSGRQPQRKAPPARFAAVRSWFDGLRAGTARGKRPARAPGGRQLALPVFGLAMLLLGALVIGLLIGRGMAPAKNSTELNAKVEKPDWVPPGDWRGAADLSAEKEVETLSSTFFVVLAFPPTKTPESERSRASRLASFLRQQGVANARIKLLPLARPNTDGDHAWATVVYAEQEDASEVLDSLQRIDPPKFEPAYAKRVAALKLQKLAAR